MHTNTLTSHWRPKKLQCCKQKEQKCIAWPAVFTTSYCMLAAVHVTSSLRAWPSPSREPNSGSVGQETPCILWDLRFSTVFTNSLALDPVLSQKQVHTLTPYSFQIHFNIIHPCTPRSPQWLFSSGFRTKKICVRFSATSCVQHLTLLNLMAQIHIWRAVQIMKLFNMKFSPPPVTSSPLGPNILLSTCSQTSLKIFQNKSFRTLHWLAPALFPPLN
jgi:hypothetical protein